MDDPARKRKHRRERLIALAFIVIASSVLGGVLWWKEQQTAALRDQTYIPQPVEMTPELELLRDYVRIDTSTPAGAAKGAQLVAAQLRRHGIEPELIESAPQRINVYARVKGRSRGDGLMLFHHIDVVPPGKQTWTAPPFEARIIGDQLHGRGTLDMKGVAI
ncbi:MAG TPA: M20/M25/M40 family metallo-hydrolase [Thermoanaerobaculia bacterium]|nr:M20/M25/M40 family metallo-hydrolase [Thermoanaerobaculia bacterium]